jgi:hypothetical protein
LTTAPEFALVAVAGSPSAWAFERPGSGHLPSENETALKVAASQPRPYAMNYAEEAAQSLGLQDGKWEAFDGHARDPLMPSVGGGLQGGRPMITFRWR